MSTDTNTESVEALAHAEALTSALAACRALIPLDKYFSLPHADEAIGDPESVPDVLGAYVRTLAAERDALKADNANLRTVMVAAAEEIHAHWHAHCDSEGYGPANLMHRLEQGIPSEYGYTAGRFAELVAKRDALLSARCPDCQWPTGQACPTCETTKDKK